MSDPSDRVCSLALPLRVIKNKRGQHERKTMNLEEFAKKVKADRAKEAEALRKINREKSKDFLATLSKEGK